MLKYFFSPFKVVGSEGSYENKSLSYQSVQTVQSNTGHYDLSNYLISHILSATKRNFISDLSKSAWQRQWRSNLRNPWTSPVVEWSWPSFQPREWNNISQDFFLWPCFDLPIDLDAWISSPCLYLESIWKPDDIGFCVGEVDFPYSACQHSNTWNAKHKHLLNSAKCPHYSKAWKQARNSVQITSEPFKPAVQKEIL